MSFNESAPSIYSREINNGRWVCEMRMADEIFFLVGMVDENDRHRTGMVG